MYWNQNRDNLLINNEEEQLEEILKYKESGGGTICDVTTIGIGRDPDKLYRISKNSGVHVVMGTGFYTSRVHASDMNERSTESLAEQMIHEITDGIGQYSVRAGLIGELGCSTVLTDNEKKVLQAAAIAQQKTGLSISIHPGLKPSCPKEILAILEESGADISRVVIGHIERTMNGEWEPLFELAQMGCFLEFDFFGLESSYCHVTDLAKEPVYVPCDFERIDIIKRLIDSGFGKKIVVGHDIYCKHRLVKYGGHGYAHILNSCLMVMKKKGISEEEIQDLLVNNMKSVLTVEY